MLTFIFGILAVVLAFGFIIFIHEMGHFVTARAVDIRCPQFALGFGPALFGHKWRGTEFAVRLFPLGGYVLMNGEEPGQRGMDPWSQSVHLYLGDAEFPASRDQLLEHLDHIPEAERTENWSDVRGQVAWARAEVFPTLRSVEGNFHDKSLLARFLVISGGVLMNFAATIAILWVLGPFVGIGSFFNGWAPVLSQVREEAPASESGLKSGDRILSVQGQALETDREAYLAIGEQQGTPFLLRIAKRGGGEEELSIRPLLAVGREVFRVDDDDSLTIHSSASRPDLVGLKVTSPKRAELVNDLQDLGPGDQYTLELEPGGLVVDLLAPDSHEVSFSLSESFERPRGQIGVLFGVSSIRFETAATSTVSQVIAGGPAESSGVEVGDQIWRVGNFRVIGNSGLGFGSLVEPALEIQHRVDPSGPLDLLLFRDGELRTVTLPAPLEEPTLGALGLQLSPVGTREVLRAPFSMISDMLKAPFMLIGLWLSSEYSGKEIVENLQGPIGIMQLIYQVSDSGVVQFLFFLALLNAAIGAFNLLPFPALDGARLFFLFLEGLRGKAVDPDKEAKVHLVGLMVLLCFVIVVSFGDVRRLISDQLFIL